MKKDFLNRYFLKIKYLVLVCGVFLLSSCKDDKQKVEEVRVWLDNALKVDNTFWGASLFGAFFDIFKNVYTDGFPILTSASLKLLVIGFALWLVFYSMKLVGAVNNPNPIDYLNNVFRRGFVVLCISIFLSSEDSVRYLLNNTAVLVVGAFSATAVEIMNSVMTNIAGSMGGADGSYVSCAADTIGSIGSKTSVDHLDAIKDTFSCVITEGHRQLAFGIAFGKLIQKLGNEFGTRVVGFFLVIFFSVIDFLIPLFLMDGLFKFMIAMILSPLFIASWAFPASRSFTKKAWAIVMGMGFQILFTIVFISISVACVRAFTAGDNTIKLLLDPASYADDSTATADIIDAIKSGSTDCLSLAFVGAFMLCMVDKMSALANDFTGAPATSVVGDVVKGAAKAVTTLVVAVAAIAVTGGAAAADVGKKLAKKAASAAADSIKKGSQ